MPAHQLNGNRLLSNSILNQKRLPTHGHEQIGVYGCFSINCMNRTTP